MEKKNELAMESLDHVVVEFKSISVIRMIRWTNRKVTILSCDSDNYR